MTFDDVFQIIAVSVRIDLINFLLIFNPTSSRDFIAFTLTNRDFSSMKVAKYCAPQNARILSGPQISECPLSKFSLAGFSDCVGYLSLLIGSSNKSRYYSLYHSRFRLLSQYRDSPYFSLAENNLIITLVFTAHNV